MKNSKRFKYNRTLAGDHRRYLEWLFDYEEKRMDTIEGKVLSIISQSGIIMSLLGLSLPSIISSAQQKGVVLPALLITSFIVALLLYILSILEAMHVLNIKKFKYMSGSTETVLQNYPNADRFYEEEIRDLIDSYENNVKLNSNKGTHLLKSRWYLKYALVMTGVFGALVAISTIQICK